MFYLYHLLVKSGCWRGVCVSCVIALAFLASVVMTVSFCSFSLIFVLLKKQNKSKKTNTNTHTHTYPPLSQFLFSPPLGVGALTVATWYDSRWQADVCVLLYNSLLFCSLLRSTFVVLALIRCFVFASFLLHFRFSLLLFSILLYVFLLLLLSLPPLLLLLFCQGGISARGAPTNPLLAVQAVGPAAEVPRVLAAGEGGSRGHGGSSSGGR